MPPWDGVNAVEISIVPTLEIAGWARAKLEAAGVPVLLREQSVETPEMTGYLMLVPSDQAELARTMLRDPQSPEELRFIMLSLAERNQQDLAAAKRDRPWSEIWWGEVGKDVFIDRVAQRMTRRQALEIRAERQNATWRGVAALAHDRFTRSWGVDWSGAENQEIGALICTIAAGLLNENPQAEPWN